MSAVIEDAIELQTSWRCPKCKRPPGWPITRWLWRNEKYGTALLDCRCGHKWQEPGWVNVDGGWVDMGYQEFGIGDGMGVWSR